MKRVRIFKMMPDQSDMHVMGNSKSARKRRGKFKPVIHKKGQE